MIIETIVGAIIFLIYIILVALMFTIPIWFIVKIIQCINKYLEK